MLVIKIGGKCGESEARRGMAAPCRGWSCCRLPALRLGSAADAGGVIAGILLVRVLNARQPELAARVLPCLPLAVPMETKLGQLLPNLGGGLLLERHPKPFAQLVTLGLGNMHGWRYFLPYGSGNLACWQKV